MQKKFYQSVLFSILIFFSCKNQENKKLYASQAIDLNNKAIEFQINRKYDSALFLLDSAIKTDSLCFLAHSNKARIYCKLKNYNKALIETKKVIQIKPELAEAWTFAGMLNNKLGDTITASKDYKMSIELLNKRILNPEKIGNIKTNKLNMAFALILAGQEMEAETELNDLKKKYPSNTLIDSFLTLNRRNILVDEYLK